MEKAFFVSDPSGLSQLSEEHSRLYFGCEFCERRIPSKDELSGAIESASFKGISFSFVTPFVTEKGLQTLTPLFELLPKGSEVIVNDWGVLKFLSSSFDFPLSLGRLLTKQQRDPRIPGFFDKLPPEMRSRLRSCAVDSAGYSSFLKDLGVSRVELDPLLQGLDVHFTDLKASIYTPYSFVTTTRFCRFASCEKGISFSKIRPCSRLCMSESFELDHPTLSSPLILVGNTQFVKIDSLPQDLSEMGIDRIVFQPKIPM